MINGNRFYPLPIRYVLLLFIIFVCVLVFSGKKQQSVKRFVSPEVKDRVVGEYIVALKPGVSPEIIKRVYKQFYVKSVKKIGSDLFLMKIKKDPGPEKINDMKIEEMRYVEPNHIYRVSPGMN